MSKPSKIIKKEIEKFQKGQKPPAPKQRVPFAPPTRKIEKRQKTEDTTEIEDAMHEAEISFGHWEEEIADIQRVLPNNWAAQTVICTK